MLALVLITSSATVAAIETPALQNVPYLVFQVSDAIDLQMTISEEKIKKRIHFQTGMVHVRVQFVEMRQIEQLQIA